MSRVLFIVEGNQYEPNVLEHLWDTLVPEYSNAKVIYAFKTHIYTLYKDLVADPDLSLISILTEKFPDELPPNADDETFQEIYLIFDYDGHVPMPLYDDDSGNRIDGDKAIMDMLQYFNDETNYGKLFINYPMVESVKYLFANPNTPSELITVKCKGPHCPNINCVERSICPPVRVFKKLAAEIAPHRQDMTKISWIEWQDIFNHHIQAAKIISSMPEGNGIEIGDQDIIFTQQLVHFISRTCPQVAVLSAFPLLFKYYLNDELDIRLNML